MIESAPYKEPDEPRDEMEQAGLNRFRRMRLTAPASGILRHEEPASVGEVVVPNEPLFRIEPAPEPEAPPRAPE